MKDHELATFTVALLNAMGRKGCGDHTTELVLMLAFGEPVPPRRAKIDSCAGDVERCLGMTWLVSHDWANRGIIS